jgi:hypothetical protein
MRRMEAYTTIEQKFKLFALAISMCQTFFCFRNVG